MRFWECFLWDFDHRVARPRKLLLGYLLSIKLVLLHQNVFILRHSLNCVCCLVTLIVFEIWNWTFDDWFVGFRNLSHWFYTMMWLVNGIPTWLNDVRLWPSWTDPSVLLLHNGIGSRFHPLNIRHRAFRLQNSRLFSMKFLTPDPNISPPLIIFRNIHI